MPIIRDKTQRQANRYLVSRLTARRATAGGLVMAAVTGLFVASSFGATAQDRLVPNPAISTMSPNEMVVARQAAMREDAGILRDALDQGPDPLSIATLLQNLTDLPELFPVGSVSDKSRALPIIWQQKEEFLSVFTEAKLAATQMDNAIKSGDTGLFDDAARALGATCDECHQTYRRPFP